MLKITKKAVSLALALVFAAAPLSSCARRPAVTDPPDDPIVELPVTEKDAPVLSGVTDVTIAAGTYFDFLNGVSAVSASGSDLTSRIKISGEVNTAAAGVYTLTYSVTDDSGNTGTAERTVYVSENPAIGAEKPVPVYTASEVYNIAEGCAVSAANTSNGSAEKAFDGDPSSRWESDWVETASLTVDLGAKLSFESIVITWEAAYATEFSLLVSDDGEEYSVLAEYSENGETTTVYRAEEGTEARYIRLYCAERKLTAYGYSVFEMQVFGYAGTVVPLSEYPVLYDAKDSSSPDWASGQEEWLLFDFGSVRAIDTLRLLFKNYIFPQTYEILVSGDGLAFTRVGIANLPYSADTFSFYDPQTSEKTEIEARYCKIAMHALSFYAPAYRLCTAEFRLGSTVVSANVTASSSRSGHDAELVLDGTDATYWENANEAEYQTVDLGEVLEIGRVDLYWRGDDGGKGKYYDLQVSNDGEEWTTVFRQTHGATQLQSVYVYGSARYLRILDYQNTDPDRYMLEGIVVNSQYPASSGEGKVEYDTTLSFPEYSVVYTENGSYLTGGTDFPSSRLIAYLDDSLRDRPVPSNDWWQGLLVQDKGYNMYMNPLTATFMSDGLWLTNPGEGYFSGLVPGNGSQTVDVDAHDLRIGYAGMSASAEVRVTDYSDYGITAVMTDDANVDKLTVFLAEGTLYAYCLFAEPQKATVGADDLVAVYDLTGDQILSTKGESYTGDAIVVCVRTHSGYETGIQKYKTESGAEVQNASVYEERYYVVSVPAATEFVRGESVISVVMKNGNYLSVGAMSCKTSVSQAEAAEQGAHGTFDLTEAALLHEHGYAFVIGTTASYTFDGTTNEVETTFSLQTMLMRSGFSSEAYTAYLPHHIANSEVNEGYLYPSVRGDCVSYAGNVFVTKDTFYGVVPTFTEPTDDGYSANALYAQLLLVYENNGGDSEPDDRLISGDPYWQGKNLHPMAMAALAADQIGATDLRESFLDKIEYILTDWFTYDPVSDAEKGAYFYYDTEWGTLYYKNSEFGAGVNLADHYFTYGYFTLAAGVLCAYRPEFAELYGDMIELLIRDYMDWERDDGLFPYMRNFDMFAGHGWAGGYADNNGGNNQESAGEALNSWVGAYLYATAVGNEDIRIAAIYGFTTELSAVKHYWFNYYGDFADCYRYGVAGQVYGASNFFGTFFNGEPLYVYGIHLIPGQEYLTSYALDASERKNLEALIENMRAEQAMWEVEESSKEIHAWQHIFIPIVAIYNAEEAIEWYEETLAKEGHVGEVSEQFNVYYLIHGMNSLGVRSTDIWAENGESATVYEKDGGYRAVCWNSTSEAKRFVFRNADGVVGSALIPACTLATVDPIAVTEKIETYTDSTSFTVADYALIENAELRQGSLVFGAEGSAEYLLSCGAKEGFCKIVLEGDLEGAELYVDGVSYALTATENGYETAPVSLTFKHTVTVRAEGGTLNGFAFVPLSLVKADIGGATATASSELNGNYAQNAVDGDGNSRWESVHGSDGETLVLALSEQITVYQLRIVWEAASAADYAVYFSETGEDWTAVAEVTSSQGARTDTVTVNGIANVKYIKIECRSRTTNYGYSIFEIEIYNFG